MSQGTVDLSSLPRKSTALSNCPTNSAFTAVLPLYGCLNLVKLKSLLVHSVDFQCFCQWLVLFLAGHLSLPSGFHSQQSKVRCGGGGGGGHFTKRLYV